MKQYASFHDVRLSREKKNGILQFLFNEQLICFNYLLMCLQIFVFVVIVVALFFFIIINLVVLNFAQLHLLCILHKDFFYYFIDFRFFDLSFFNVFFFFLVQSIVL